MNAEDIATAALDLVEQLDREPGNRVLILRRAQDLRRQLHNPLWHDEPRPLTDDEHARWVASRPPAEERWRGGTTGDPDGDWTVSTT